MQKQSKIIWSVAVVLVLVVVALWGFKKADAMERSGSFPELSLKIAERFKLDKGEVDRFFLEEREKQRMWMKTQKEQRLERLVEEKKITEDQKISLLKLLEKQQSELSRFFEKSFEARQKQFEAHRSELEKWSSDNGIVLSDLGIFGPGFPGKGPGRHLKN